MIIKGMLTPTLEEPTVERWMVYDNIKNYQLVLADNHDKEFISFEFEGDYIKLYIRYYDKFFIMNDCGKTVETLKNVL